VSCFCAAIGYNSDKKGRLISLVKISLPPSADRRVDVLCLSAWPMPLPSLFGCSGGVLIVAGSCVRQSEMRPKRIVHCTTPCNRAPRGPAQQTGQVSCRVWRDFLVGIGRSVTLFRASEYILAAAPFLLASDVYVVVQGPLPLLQAAAPLICRRDAAFSVCMEH
jgi:hypothetical protein